MKLKKYLAIMLLAATTTGFLGSCSDNDNKGDAPRLFRPIASLETSNNTIKATWDNISGATSYQLTLYRVAGTDEAGENEYEPVTTVTCESSPYTFTDLAWDEKYMVEISCSGATSSSKSYITKDVNVSYPTSLKNVKTIDNAARITWDLSGVKIKAIVASPDLTEIDGLVIEPIIKTITTAQYEAGTVDIYGLVPEIKYTFTAYSDSEEFNNDTYAGKLSGTTKTPDNFDEKYGAGMWIDIRDYEEKTAKDTLKTSEFWEQITDGMTIILRGDFEYKVNNSVPLNRSVRFVTASTLGENARFISSGGLTLAKNSQVEFLEFKNVDFYSDKAIPDGGYEVATNTDKGFGGRQVFNENGTSSTLQKLTFDGCHVEGYRAMIRLQGNNDHVNNITIKNCTINGIGDQGVITTNNKAQDLQSITIKNSTITNIVMLTDLRKTAGDLAFTIENCTFCYAPIETNVNANTPMFRFAGNENTINLTVSRTVFGPSMYAGGNGGNITTYKAGTVGSIFINPGTATLVSAANSYKTNFTWTEIGAGEAAKTYPIDGLLEAGGNETYLWTAPSNGEFRYAITMPEDNIGDPRWLE